MDITLPLLMNARSLVDLGDANRVLRGALTRSGYDTISYFEVPRGFALVTRLEQIEATGEPKRGASRWAVDALKVTISDFSLTGYLRALLTANPGHYRIIVLIVTDYPVWQSAHSVSFDQAISWIHGGMATLPREIAAKPWLQDSACMALVYEFIRTDGHAPEVLVRGGLEARTHLGPVLRMGLGFFL